MFCDLIGSTALSQQLDPEDLRDQLRAYQDASAAVVTRYEGFIAKYMGDGILVYFGYPQAHEDDAERSINTSLGIVEAVNRLPYNLSVRIGIATGMVVVGDVVVVVLQGLRIGNAVRFGIEVVAENRTGSRIGVPGPVVGQRTGED